MCLSRPLADCVRGSHLGTIGLALLDECRLHLDGYLMLLQENKKLFIATKFTRTEARTQVIAGKEYVWIKYKLHVGSCHVLFNV